MRIWEQSHPDLRQAVLDFLADDDSTFDGQAVIEMKLPLVWYVDEMESSTEAFLIQHPDFDSNDVALML